MNVKYTLHPTTVHFVAARAHRAQATYTSGQRLGYEGMMKWNISTHYLENGFGALPLPSSIVPTPGTPWLDHRIEVVQHGARPRRQPSM
jgi:hypothetical protein